MADTTLRMVSGYRNDTDSLECEFILDFSTFDVQEITQYIKVKTDDPNVYRPYPIDESLKKYLETKFQIDLGNDRTELHQ